jgi:23S rRNA (adenine2503-C2)-methyltransferase
MKETIKSDIRRLSKDALEMLMKENNWPRYRADQIWEWVWTKQRVTFDQFKNLPKDLVGFLENNFTILPVTVDKVQKSIDGTIKSRMKLFDDHLVESVLIPVQNDKRFTVCVSSQVGCSLSCAFCATGQMKRMRNLDASEIYDQVALVNKQCLETYDHPLTNIVYMGMGEPLLNYANVLSSIDHISSPKGLGMSPRRITVSTVGIAKMIRKLADDKVRFNLALSLHAADDVKRSTIMPINEQNNLSTLMDALTYFHKTTGNRISYEYIAFDNFNDTLEDAENLLKYCKLFPVRVNIIEYNNVSGVNFEKSKASRLDQFAKYLTQRGVMVTVRRSRGKDIDAACGQLANKG